MAGEFRREVRFEAGYDKVAEGRGLHGLQIRFLLHGELGTVQFLVYTDWLPGDAPTIGRHRQAAHNATADMFPMAADLGYHWRAPQYAGQETLRDEPCEYLGVPCYYDGSGLRAERVLTALFDGGDAAVWPILEAEYRALVSYADEVTR